MLDHPESTAPIKLIELQSAVSQRSISFEQIVDAIYLSSVPDAHNNHPIAELLPKIFEVFTCEHGRIIRFYYCSQRRVAAILTQKDDHAKPTWRDSIVATVTGKPVQGQATQWEFFTEYMLGEDPGLEHLLIECDQLAVETRRLLAGNELETCNQMLYTIAKRILCLMEYKDQSLPNSPYTPPESVENQATLVAKDGVKKDATAKTANIDTMSDLVSKQLKIARQYHERAAQLKAQHYYIQGMLGGILFVVLLGLLSIGVDKPGFTHTMFLSLLICGAIGAVVSIMSRMSSRNLKLDYQAGKWMIRQIGIFRPVMGALFAVVVYALLQSTWLPIKMPSGDNPTIFVVYVLAFLAGFSERLVPDILHVTGQRVTGPNDQPDAQD